MLRKIDKLAIEMGSRTDWQRCTWCWAWGKSTLLKSDDDIEWGCVHLYSLDVPCDCPYAPYWLCEKCCDLEEPPWYPNASWRAANAMELFLPLKLREVGGLLKGLSWYVVENDP